MQEVLPDTDQVQVTLTDDSYISLPKQLFENLDEPGLVNTATWTYMHLELVLILFSYLPHVHYTLPLYNA